MPAQTPFTGSTQLELIQAILGISRDEDGLAGGLPAETTHITFGAFERDGKRFVWLEKCFPSEQDMRATLAAQAGDPDDPNPLPVGVAVLDCGSAAAPGEVQLSLIEYNPVSGLDYGSEGWVWAESMSPREELDAASDTILSAIFDER